MGLSHNIADWLLEIKAVKLNVREPFTWASGLKSPIYCDNRKILSFPKIRSEIVNAFVEKASSYIQIQAIAGVATAGIAWGALIADRLGLPFAYVRSKPKEHGLKNLMEGELEANSKVLVIEDLISTGSSSLDVVHVLEESGHDIQCLLAIFQYGFPDAKAKFLKINMAFDTLTDFPTLLERALQRNYINKTEYENLIQWNLDPNKWSDQFQSQKASL